MNATDQFLPKCSISHLLSLAHMFTFIDTDRRVVFCDEARNRTTLSIVQIATVTFSAIYKKYLVGLRRRRAVTWPLFRHLFNPRAHAAAEYYILSLGVLPIDFLFRVSSRRALCVCYVWLCRPRVTSSSSNNSQQLARHIRIDLLRPLSLTWARSLAGSWLLAIYAQRRQIHFPPAPDRGHCAPKKRVLTRPPLNNCSIIYS